MSEILEFSVWRENLLHNFREVTTEQEFSSLALCYPDKKSDKDKCKQRKNNLLRNGNRNIYLDDLYALSCYSEKTPNSLLLGENNIASFWSELEGENLFSADAVEIIADALKSDKNYRNIFIPKQLEDFLYYSRSVVFEVNNKKIRRPIFNITDNSLDFITEGKAKFSYNPHLFYGGDVYDVFCDYVSELDSEAFPECDEEAFEKFIDTISVYLDSGKSEAEASDSDIKFRIKNWVCNCTMWLLLSYIGDTCERLSEDVDRYLRSHREIIIFMFRLFVFGARVTRQKRITDELTNQKKRVRYSAYLGCDNEKLVAQDEDFDYYDYDFEYKTASISDMQKSSLTEILDYELR
ncbi:MAG: hypothetical protein E7557_03235 [Ruminococcaceae bacterium]|nr:hypothetical protein [Oscillospiraceae bacterium]